MPLCSAPLRPSILLALACAAAGATAPSTAAATGVDPLRSGPAPVERLDYQAGQALVGGGTQGATYAQELRGSLHIPISPSTEKLPVVVLLHGRHATCSAVSVETLGSPCPTTPATASVDSFAGYDALAANLASHGYLVLSIDANGINTYDTANLDAGAWARAQTIAKSLDLLAAWNAGRGPGEVDESLVGRVDLTRIGMMGHSRGGEGVTQFIAYNRIRPATADPTLGPDSGPRYPGLKAVLALAPIDAADQTPTGVAFGTLLPVCDGDVSDLSGSRPWERTKGDPSPRVQWAVQGTNHNYFNSVWVDDDNGGSTDGACGEDVAGNTRLAKLEQRRVGVALMASFLRRYIGGETALDGFVTGATQLPAAACPAKLSCGDAVQVSYVPPAAERRAVPGTPTLTGFTASGTCTPTDAGDGCPAAGGGPAVKNRSTTAQRTLRWDGAATASWALGGAAADASRLGTLTFRAAANHGDATINPPGVTQDLDVVLVDADGRSASVAAAPYARGALIPSRGTTSEREVVLGGARIPLAAFAGVDLTRLARLELRFGARTPRGSIQLADLAFQEPAPATGPPTTTTPTTTTPPTTTDPATTSAGAGEGAGAASAAGGGGTGSAAGPAVAVAGSSCRDVVPPRIARLRAQRTGAGRLLVTGTATDRGCGARVAAVRVAVALRTGRRCRVLRADGRLTAARSCLRLASLPATGRARFRFARRVPAGRLLVVARAIDGAGLVGRRGASVRR